MKQVEEKSIRELENHILGAEHPVIITHTHPDGDALGSSFGMMALLISLGKDARLVLPDPIPDTLAFVPTPALTEFTIVASEDMGRALATISSSDLLICQDFNTPSRAEGLENAITGASCRKVLIDHHLEPDRELFDLCISEPGMSSASELLFWILLGFRNIGGEAGRLPAETARDLFIGMTTDTNNFANSATPSTFRMAAELLSAGVDRDGLLEKIFQNHREERLRLLGYLLSQKLHITGDGVAYMILTSDEARRFDIHDGDTEAFVNEPLAIAGVRMSIFLKEQGDRYRVSIRAKRGTSARNCAVEFFHGGGHELASGGRLGIPADVTDEASAAAWIETSTKKFFQR